MLKRISVKIFFVIIIWFLTHSLIITLDGINDEILTSDVAIVLGNMVQKNGKPSLRLKSRLDTALLLFENKYFKKIIVSGGISDDGMDEARIMKNYLVANGIPDSSILVDSKGNNTYLTAMHSVSLMKKNKFKTALVISQFYHISRIKLAFSKAGIKNISSAYSDYFEVRDIYSLFREFFAYYRYLMI